MTNSPEATKIKNTTNKMLKDNLAVNFIKDDIIPPQYY